MERINVFCLPFAGGSAYSYKTFEYRASRRIRIVPIDYPGRGLRSMEPLLDDMNEIVEDVYRMIAPFIERGDQYAVYGHSMGGMIGWLLVKRIIECGGRSPIHLFITGIGGPSYRDENDLKVHLLNRAEFIKEIVAFNGSAPEVFANDELFEYIEPILRADFKAVETFKYEGTTPVNVPFSVITGCEDNISDDEIECWQRESSLPVDFRKMPGDHFFINSHAPAILELIEEKIFYIAN